MRPGARTRGVGGGVVANLSSDAEQAVLFARHPDRFRVVALGAHRNAVKLADQCAKFSVPYAAMADEAAARELADLLRVRGAPTRIMSGSDALKYRTFVPVSSKAIRRPGRGLPAST